MAVLEVMRRKVLEVARPQLMAKAEAFLAAGIDPATITWEALAGRPASALRAEVEARRARPRDLPRA